MHGAAPTHLYSSSLALRVSPEDLDWFCLFVTPEPLEGGRELRAPCPTPLGPLLAARDRCEDAFGRETALILAASDSK